MTDFTKTKFIESDAMRYDTPGDWYSDVIEAWSGLEKPEYIRCVQFHELIEATILTAATPNAEKWVDILDGDDEDAKKEIPWCFKNLYQRAHVLALLAERELAESYGLNWTMYEDVIEESRDKIPVRGA